MSLCALCALLVLDAHSFHSCSPISIFGINNTAKYSTENLDHKKLKLETKQTNVYYTHKPCVSHILLSPTPSK